jgi:hypothetical protein
LRAVPGFLFTQPALGRKFNAVEAIALARRACWRAGLDSGHAVAAGGLGEQRLDARQSDDVTARLAISAEDRNGSRHGVRHGRARAV